ncbi:MAG TPA: pectinesterase family protein [Polyangia bacterium]|nr:pectinesterase family protein [Polyangia bacterium]
MKTTLISTRTLFFFAVAASFATGCSSSSTPEKDAGSQAGSGGGAGTGGGGAAGTGGSGATAGTTGTSDGGAGTGGTTGTDGGTAPFVYFVQQANGTTTATLSGGTFTVNSTYGASGNGFKYVAPNYYGTVSNGFLAFPTPMTGDFSITAQVNITTQNKANNACGIGVGITTGFGGSDSYAYALMRNTNNSTNGYSVSGAGTLSAGAPTVAFTNGTPLQLTFSRAGSNVTYAAGPVGGTATTSTLAASLLTNGTTAYGAGAVYPAISFNNVAATITGLVIKDASGSTVYDSATGTLVNYVPASLIVSAASVNLNKGASGTVIATANAIGGALSAVTAVSADPTIATATVAQGATNSTITLNGVKGGATTVTVTNTGDPNSATNTKTFLVSVAEYAATDPYGSLAARAYPVPGATSAYTDGELALTFDAPPTLNTGGLIKILALADGSEVDSIGFTGETQTFGTTVVNVGSQLVRVSGNTVFFTPHLGKLVYGAAYYVAIPTTAITGTLNAVAFNGLSNLKTVATWSFTTRAAPVLTATVTVDGSQTSTANFRTLQGALGSLATVTPSATNFTINIAAGTYNELVHYTGPGATQTISIIGPTGNAQGNTCIVQYSNGNAINGSTQTRAAMYFSGTNLILQNIAVKNTGVRSVVSQAEALFFGSGGGFTLAAFNSSFYSNQDTIQTSGRNWFYDCYVEGNVDFIWGTADAALFESCSLHFINDLAGAAASYGLFVARTGTTIAAGASGTVPKGYVLLDSTVSVDANVTAFFGRDAGVGAFYDQAALVNVVFSGAGMIGAGIWNVTTAPLSLGDSSYVGWKSAGCSGLNLATLTTDPKTSAAIAGQAAEYDTRDHILNRVVTVTAGVPTGYQAATTTWDVSSLATAWGAP